MDRHQRWMHWNAGDGLSERVTSQIQCNIPTSDVSCSRAHPQLQRRCSVCDLQFRIQSTERHLRTVTHKPFMPPSYSYLMMEFNFHSDVDINAYLLCCYVRYVCLEETFHKRSYALSKLPYSPTHKLSLHDMLSTIEPS